MQRAEVPGLPRMVGPARVRQSGHLIGTDDPGFRMLHGDGFGLGERKPA